MMLMTKPRRLVTKPKHVLVKELLSFIIVALFFTAGTDDLSLNTARNNLRSRKSWSNPIRLRDTKGSRRDLSINLGGGECIWEPAQEEVPDDIKFYKTLLAGYPSGDKRLIFLQMEALTGWPTKDEWDFKYLGMSNHPFIKSNYPHHEGTWGWGDVADQVVLLVRNIRRSMIEYHDILWDIKYAKNWETANVNRENLYSDRPPLDDFLEWRDKRVMDEIHWYGWHIDYWMEGGLQRDMFTHKITTNEHWQMLMQPHEYTKKELAYDTVVGDDIVTQSYDPHCTNGDISGGCEPVAIISADKLTDLNVGPSETVRIAKILMNNPKISEQVIDKEAWGCIWRELILKKKGLRTVYNRPGRLPRGNQFSPEMLEAMIDQLDRLIAKYSSSDWETKLTAIRLVELLAEHRGKIKDELEAIKADNRELSDTDILGPEERKRQRQQGTSAGDSGFSKEALGQTNETKSEYFMTIERDIEKRRKGQEKKDALALKSLEEKLLEEAGFVDDTDV